MMPKDIKRIGIAYDKVYDVGLKETPSGELKNDTRM